MVATSLAIFSVLHLSSCSNAAEPIKIGVDNCYYCKMTISDNKYGAEVITKKGKIFKFDDTHCLVSEIKEGGIGTSIVGEIYFSDFCTPHSLVKSDHAFYLQSSEMKAPMGGNIAVFGSLDSLNVYKARVGGSEISWSQVLSIR